MASCLKLTFFFFVVPLLLLVFSPGIPPEDIVFEAEEAIKVPFKGKLAANNKLDLAEDFPSELEEGVGFGKLGGPEAFATKDDYLYTGLNSGDIVRYNLKSGKDEKWKLVVRMGFPCKHIYEQKICGRPLGMQFDRHGYLIVADAYYGIFRVDVDQGTKKALILPEEEGEPTLFNSVAVTIGGDIYYSISSTKYSLAESMLEILAVSSPSGKVIKFVHKTKAKEVLLDKIGFANGITLSPREDFILVNDIGRTRILRHYVKGPKKGQTETFAQVPGAPDNITPNGNSGYLVGVVAPMLPDKFSAIADVMYPYKLARRTLARILFNLKNLFEALNEMFPNPVFGSAAFWVANTEIGANLAPGYGLVIEYDKDGNVLQSWHSQTGNVRFICEAFLHGGYMYLGSPYNEGVKRLKYQKVE